jgi:hypothetical protein
MSRGPSFSLRGGFKKTNTKDEYTLDWDSPGKDTPGPGKYYPRYISSKVIQAAAYSISPRRKLEIG